MIACETSYHVIRVLLADDHPLILDGLQTNLARKENIAIVGLARDGYQSQSMCDTLKPDVLLLDLDMDGPPIYKLVQQLKTKTPQTKIIILTGYKKPDILPLILPYISGYVFKTSSTETLYQAIITAMQDEVWLEPSLIQKLVAQQQSPDGSSPLTERQQAVLRLAAQGLSNAEIAEWLVISARTVRAHLQQAYRKLGVNDRSGAVAWAIRAGLG